MSQVTRYFPEFWIALAAIPRMTNDDLLKQLDALYGRDRITDPTDRQALEDEARRQLMLDFLNPEYPLYSYLRQRLENR